VSLALEEAGTVAAAVSIEARELSHRYAPGRGLDPVSFAIRSPGVVAITGSNGSGKSTLVRILAGLLRPSDGSSRLEVGGNDVPPSERRAVVGFASPDLWFYDELSAAENLRFAAEARGLDGVQEAVRAALEGVGLGARADDRVGALSSGTRQRLRLAFALLHRPPVLLLDEPGSHLDHDGRECVERIVKDHAATGIVVLATNDAREWELAGERIELRVRGLGHPA
jgi:heme exporter protein A